MKDLVILVADKGMEYTIRGGLSRPQRLGIRELAVERDVVFRQHMGRDGGMRTSGPQLLALERHRYKHALLVMDYEGCGATEPAHDLETALDAELARYWDDRAKAIVIEPELDIWLWGSDNALAQVLDWPEPHSIRSWLESQDFEVQENGKPVRPKEALEAVFPICGIPRSAANYQRIAASISLKRCEDLAFQRLRDQLCGWFPQEGWT